MAARKIYEIAVDLGNIEVKGAMMTDNEEVILKRFANKVTSRKTANPKAIKLEQNGEVLFLGVGDLNNKSKKYDRAYLEEQVLVMINELLPNQDYIMVDLKLGLPPQQYFSDVALDKFKNKFTLDKDIEFRVNGQYKKVKINSVKVFMEGYSAFKAIESQELLGKSKKRILGIDLGGGTLDVCDYEFDYDDNCFYPNEPMTIENGIVDMTKAIATAINDKNTDTVTAEQVEYAIRNNLDLIEDTYKLDDYKKAINHITNDIITKIQDFYGIQSFDLVQVLGLGAGFNNFNKLTNNAIKNDIVVSDELMKFGNAIGYLCQ